MTDTETAVVAGFVTFFGLCAVGWLVTKGRQRDVRRCRCGTQFARTEPRCPNCGGDADVQAGCGRCGRQVSAMPRVWPGLHRVLLVDALTARQCVLCEPCGWRQANLKPLQAHSGDR